MSVYSLDDGGKELPSDIRDQLLSLRRLDAKCAELNRKLQKVRKQRDAAYDQLERYCQSRAPIRRVPCEVLAIIFSNYPEAQKSRNSSLIRVCKLWHRILMETPSLWNHISLDLGRIEELPLLWTYARACLIQSGSLPLYILLDGRNFKPNHSMLELGATFDDRFAYSYSDYSAAEKTLGPVTHMWEREDEIVRIHERVMLMTLAILRGDDDIFLTRWRTLHCYLEAPAGDSYVAEAEGMRLWDSMDGITDNLVDLVFSLDCSYSLIGDWRPNGFPNMNSLQAFSTSLDVNLNRLSLPTATMKRLSLLHENTSDHFLGFASNAFTSLRLLELKFRDRLDGWMDDNSTQAIRLPALEVLAVTGGEYELITRRFDAPNLTHLSLEYSRPPEQDTPSIFNTITDLLGFLDWRCDSATLRRLISSTPSLRRMHIRRTRHSFQGIAALWRR